MERARILVVDDKENILELFERMLGEDHELTTACDGTRALSVVGAREFDVVVTDLKMPGPDGFEVLRGVKSRLPETEVIMMTGYATVADAVGATKQGAYDYLEKPFDRDDAARVIARAVERRRLRMQVATLRRELEGVCSFHSLVGKSSGMRDVYRLPWRSTLARSGVRSPDSRPRPSARSRAILAGQRARARERHRTRHGRREGDRDRARRSAQDGAGDPAPIAAALRRPVE